MAANQVDPRTLCAACGERMDRHGLSNICPRFVPSKIIDEPRPSRSVSFNRIMNSMVPGAIGFGPGYDLPTTNAAPDIRFTTIARDMVSEVEAKAKAAYENAAARIKKLEQQLESVVKTNQALQTKIDLDAKLMRRLEGKIDYTQWVDDADCLTDETRGGMRAEPKERIVF